MPIKLEKKKSVPSVLTFGDLCPGDLFQFVRLGPEYKSRIFMKLDQQDLPNCVAIVHELLGSGNLSTELKDTKVIRLDNVILTIPE